MGWTKRQIVVKAFSEIGYASYIYDVMPEQLYDALTSLEAMIGDWETMGIETGYPISDNPTAEDLDVQTNVTINAYTAIYANLALDIAPMFGKTVSPQTSAKARRGYVGLLNMVTFPRQQQLPSTMPLGAGNKGWRGNRVFVTPPTKILNNINGDQDISDIDI